MDDQNRILKVFIPTFIHCNGTRYHFRVTFVVRLVAERFNFDSRCPIDRVTGNTSQPEA